MEQKEKEEMFAISLPINAMRLMCLSIIHSFDHQTAEVLGLEEYHQKLHKLLSTVSSRKEKLKAGDELNRALQVLCQRVTEES